MDFEEESEFPDIFVMICPECCVGNPEGTEYCIFCDKDLRETVLFLEDDSFDVEITRKYLIEYKKKFWGEERSGKVNKYSLNEIEKIEIGYPIPRFIFYHKGERAVLPLKEENLIKIKEFFKIE